ncbi:MAG: DNA repair protein RecN [Bacteroidia bacterium]|nr:DNA repair protein RecN [Bacteroidia bacterium]
MLVSLNIQNYAIIDHVGVKFSENLNIITGETGAGKSILIGALGLILGERADTKVLLKKERKCVIEGAFNIARLGLKPFFNEYELDYEDVTIVRREINQSGKSRAFINDTPVNLNQLKELGANLVDIHSQHQTLNLKSFSFQLSVLDSFTGHIPLVKEYSEKYQKYLETTVKLNQLLEKESNSMADMDYIQFQLEELTSANLEVNEQEKLESELKTAEHAEEIKQKLAACHDALTNEDNSVITQLNVLKDQVSSLSNYSDDLSEIYSRLNSLCIELEDISSEIGSKQQDVDYEPEMLAELNDRLSTIYRLQQKHNVQSIEELIRLADKLSNQASGVNSLKEEIEQLEKDIRNQKKECLALADKISNGRKSKIAELEDSVHLLLEELALHNSTFKIDHTSLEEDQLNKYGKDNLKFLFSANKGVNPMEIGEVASGGELSRLMLAIKSLITESASLPTIIFDEIDTGVSGDVAFKVGGVINAVSENHQVISITHLPQIACTGDTHLFVYKEEVENTTKTFIKQLNQDERIVEIAKMIGGEKPTATAVENAKELLSN